MCWESQAVVWNLPWVARFVIQPTALHWTSTLGDPIWRTSWSSPPSFTIKSLFSASVDLVCWRSFLHVSQLTVYSEISQSSACGSLNFDIMRLQQEQDGVQSVTTHLADVFLGNFCKCECCWSLQVYVVWIGQGGKGLQRLSLKKVGVTAIYVRGGDVQSCSCCAHLSSLYFQDTATAQR